MPEFINAIDNYDHGASGTLTAPDGSVVDYSVSNKGGATNTYGTRNSEYGDLAGAMVSGASVVDVTFERPVTGLTIAMTSSNAGEVYAIRVDGVETDLNTLVAKGLVSFSSTLDDGTPGSHAITSDGHVTSNGHWANGSVGEIRFLGPVSSIGVQGTGDGGWDTFDIGFSSQTRVVCFAAGTRIATPDGTVPVERLVAGDPVLTRDHGPRPIRWVGSFAVGEAAMRRDPRLCPIRVGAGALGDGYPSRPLLVSRQHRILMPSRAVADGEVLVPAIWLVGRPGIALAKGVPGVRYHHLLFDRHEILHADGAPAESLYLGPQALETLSAGPSRWGDMVPARPLLRARRDMRDVGTWGDASAGLCAIG